MSEASQYLRRVKNDFEAHGIRNEVQITEHVALLLLIQDTWDELLRLRASEARPLLKQLEEELERGHLGLRIPQPPPTQQWGREPLDMVRGLQLAFENSPLNNSWGEFFQREIRFELLKGSSGSQYPTPYHIAEFMATLALTGTVAAIVFDPAAGSSGLLTACTNFEVSTLIGCDFDPQWAGIGSASLILHGVGQANYHVGSALEYANSRSSSVDAVLMNPPFGGTRNAYEVAESVGRRFGRSNATVLTALALQSLKLGGRAAVLVPSGVLFGGGGEANLRQELSLHNLEAIVRLSKGAFQPYSQVGANLLVFQKLPEGTTTPSQLVWFLVMEGDGYDPGMGRDLTVEPEPNLNDLPKVRDLILQTRVNQWETQLALPLGNIQTARQQDEAGLPGVSMRVIDSPDGVQWAASFLTDGLFISLSNQSNAWQGWLFEPLTGEERHFFAALTDSAPSNPWPDLINADNWETNCPADWQDEEGDVSLTVNTETVFTLNDSYRFTDDAQATVQACLLGEDGNPLTPWLNCDDSKLVAALDAEPEKNKEKNKLKAVPIQDGLGKRCGWIIELTAISGEETGEAMEGTLLLTPEEQVQPFTNDDRFFLLLKNGWITFDPAGDSKVALNIGQIVSLPENIRFDGLAVGPGLGDRNHHLFGLWVARSEFVDEETGNVGDLRPARFFPEPEAAILEKPTDLLASIRRNQESIKERVDVLLRALGKQTVPNPEAAELPRWVTQILGSQQRTFWNLLAQQKSGDRPTHFNIEHVKKWCDEDGSLDYQEDDIQLHLELFVKLGLIQHVHVKGDEREGDYYENLYRALTKGDILELEE